MSVVWGFTHALKKKGKKVKLELGVQKVEVPILIQFIRFGSIAAILSGYFKSFSLNTHIFRTNMTKWNMFKNNLK